MQFHLINKLLNVSGLHQEQSLDCYVYTRDEDKPLTIISVATQARRGKTRRM